MSICQTVFAWSRLLYAYLIQLAQCIKYCTSSTLEQTHQQVLSDNLLPQWLKIQHQIMMRAGHQRKKRNSWIYGIGTPAPSVENGTRSSRISHGASREPAANISSVFTEGKPERSGKVRRRPTPENTLRGSITFMVGDHCHYEGSLGLLMLSSLQKAPQSCNLGGGQTAHGITVS